MARSAVAHQGIIILADQAVCSATNFALVLCAARTLGADGLGAVTVAVAVGLGVVALSRAFVGETALVFSGVDGSAWSGALLVAVSGTPMVLFASLLLSGTVGSALTVVALGLAPIVFQDTGRYLMFRAGEPRAALVSDVAWLGAQTVILVAVTRVSDMTAAVVVGAWIIGAIAGILAMSAARAAIRHAWRLRSGAHWIRSTRSYSGWLAAQALTALIGGQAILVTTAAAAGLAATGGLKAAMSMAAPLALALASLPPLLLPQFRREVEVDGRVHSESFRKVVIATSTMSGVYVVGLVGFGNAVLPWLFGSEFDKFSPLLVPMGIAFLMYGLAVAPGLGARALHGGRAVFITQAGGTAVGIGAVTALAFNWGAEGAAYGIAVQGVVVVVLSYALYRRLARSQRT